MAQWKKQALEELPQVFADRRGREARAAEEETSRRYEQVGLVDNGTRLVEKNSAPIGRPVLGDPRGGASNRADTPTVIIERG